MKLRNHCVLRMLICVMLLASAIPQQAYAGIQGTLRSTDQENMELLGVNIPLAGSLIVLLLALSAGVFLIKKRREIGTEKEEEDKHYHFFE